VFFFEIEMAKKLALHQGNWMCVHSIPSFSENKLTMESTIFTQRQAVTIKNKIELLMMASEPFYLDRQLTLVRFAKLIQISPRKVSSFLLQEYGMSFVDFIHELRFQYMVNSMKKDAISLYTLDGLAAMSGFNSRSVFYRRFKQKFGVSPKRYFKKS
jgi:AraC-like DNA-binding protein